MNILLWILSLIFTGFLISSYSFIKKIPDMVTDRIKENKSFKNNRTLQMESYFKQQSGYKQFKVFDEWMRAITYMKVPDNQETYKSLIHRTLVYGSDETIRVLSAYIQHINNKPNVEEKNIKDKDTLNIESSKYDLDIDNQGIITTMFIVSIIASLKYDFSGYRINPLILLQSNLTDYQNAKNNYEKAYEIVLKKIDLMDK